jgi:hypothetical protein
LVLVWQSQAETSDGVEASKVGQQGPDESSVVFVIADLPGSPGVAGSTPSILHEAGAAAHKETLQSQAADEHSIVGRASELVQSRRSGEVLLNDLTTLECLSAAAAGYQLP